MYVRFFILAIALVNTSAFVPKVCFTSTVSVVPLISSKLHLGTNDDSLRNTVDVSNHKASDRRSFFSSVVKASAIVPTFSMLNSAESVLAADVEYVPYEDAECGFKLMVPKGWEMTTQSLRDRRKIVFFIDPSTAESTEKTLMFIAYTPVRDDFTQISSFGTVDQVGEMTILPKGTIGGVEGTESKMLLSESKKNAYFFDYVVKTPEQPKRHLRTIFSLANGATGGAGAVLVTLTAQTADSNYADVKPVFDEMFNSYGKFTK
eukprot:CAMPEP_0195521740 /NCGR_PEP_ID=MMETSP0794_2-20130614/19271_1 /TAXON_ID=515487 /ORGANISM="Stephanopyxis turris, Strain CCMP 815" /LENGTH=261 /DNA_ID=CAMNT_0040651359 /DNA_START=9 /DNA_END=794 /DNA_ORIENTATION=+